MVSLSCLLSVLSLSLFVKGEESLESKRVSLAELPLDKLLHVKQALSTKEMFDKGDLDDLRVEPEEESPLPLRTPVQDKRRPGKPNRRGDSWEEDSHGGGGKGKDISSIFQSTVTILSFLAFGGYLLCLIVQAVKGSMGTGAGMMPTMPTAAPPAAIVGKRRRRRRAVPEEQMMETLHRIAEAYAKHGFANRDL